MSEPSGLQSGWDANNVGSVSTVIGPPSPAAGTGTVAMTDSFRNVSVGSQVMISNTRRASIRRPAGWIVDPVRSGQGRVVGPLHRGHIEHGDLREADLAIEVIADHRETCAVGRPRGPVRHSRTVTVPVVEHGRRRNHPCSRSRSIRSASRTRRRAGRTRSARRRPTRSVRLGHRGLRCPGPACRSRPGEPCR